jgi:hypothetical protein
MMKVMPRILNPRELWLLRALFAFFFLFPLSFIYLGWQTIELQCERTETNSIRCSVKESLIFGIPKESFVLENVKGAEVRKEYSMNTPFRGDRNPWQERVFLIGENESRPLSRFSSNKETESLNETAKTIEKYLKSKSSTPLTLKFTRRSAQAYIGFLMLVGIALFVPKVL